MTTPVTTTNTAGIAAAAGPSTTAPAPGNLQASAGQIGEIALPQIHATAKLVPCPLGLSPITELHFATPADKDAFSDKYLLSSNANIFRRTGPFNPKVSTSKPLITVYWTNMRKDNDPNVLLAELQKFEI